MNTPSIKNAQKCLFHLLCKRYRLQNEQIFFLGIYQKLMESPITTTGNELRKQQIADYAKALNIDASYQYIKAVKDSTDNILKRLTFADIKRKINDKEKELLKSLRVVKEDTHAYWLGYKRIYSNSIITPLDNACCSKYTH